MVQCKKCKQFISLTKDEIVKCKGPCEAQIHKKCARNIKTFAESGMCNGCSKMEGSPSPGAACVTAPKITLDLGQATVDTVLSEVNTKLEIIFNMQKKLQELTDTVEFYAEQYQQMSEFKEKAERKIADLEKKNVFFEKCNKAMEERIIFLEQKEREKNVEISNLEQKDDENIKEVITTIAQKLKIDISCVEEARRVGAKKHEEKKPRSVVITLRSRAARDEWMKQKKSYLTNGQIYGNGSKQPIYINENLTKPVRQLFWNTKNQLKEICKYIWVQNSRILVKKSDNGKIYNIRSEIDIERVREAEIEPNTQRCNR